MSDEGLVSILVAIVVSFLGSVAAGYCVAWYSVTNDWRIQVAALCIATGLYLRIR